MLLQQESKMGKEARVSKWVWEKSSAFDRKEWPFSVCLLERERERERQRERDRDSALSSFCERVCLCGWAFVRFVQMRLYERERERESYKFQRDNGTRQRKQKIKVFLSILLHHLQTTFWQNNFTIKGPQETIQCAQMVALIEMQ